MKGFQKFTSKELTGNEASALKGGVFCEVYIGYSDSNKNGMNYGQMSKAMKLDQIAAEDGMAAALEEGGSDFLARYS